MALTKKQKDQLDDLLDNTVATALVEDLDIVSNKKWNEAIQYMIDKLQESKR